MDSDEWDSSLDRQLPKDCDVSPDTVIAVVMDYLVREGHVGTAKAFGDASNTPLSESQLAHMEERKAIVALLGSGKIAEAEARLRAQWATVLDDRDVRFYLVLQTFLECVRDGRTADALAHGRAEFSKLGHLAGEKKEMLQDAVALLAYADPASSPVGNLLKAAQRDALCARVERALLVAQGHAARPLLESIFQHMKVMAVQKVE